MVNNTSNIGYIDIKRISEKYIIEYFLAKTHNGIKSFGVIAGIGEKPEQLKEYLESFFQKTYKKIILKSTKPKEFQEKYSEIPPRELSQIMRSLSHKIKDITFSIEEQSVPNYPIKRTPHSHKNITNIIQQSL